MKICKGDKMDFELPSDIDFKFIEQEISFDMYKITYSYKTIRRNNKENHKYLLANDFEEARYKFIEYINKFNRENEHRPVLNVKILNTELLGTITK